MNHNHYHDFYTQIDSRRITGLIIKATGYQLCNLEEGKASLGNKKALT